MQNKNMFIFRVVDGWGGGTMKKTNHYFYYFLTPFKPDNFTPQNEIFYSGEDGWVRSLVSFLTLQGTPGSHPSTHPLIALSVQCSAVLHPSVMVFFISLADLFKFYEWVGLTEMNNEPFLAPSSNLHFCCNCNV